jgi:hypothetical protein
MSTGVMVLFSRLWVASFTNFMGAPRLYSTLSPLRNMGLTQMKSETIAFI